MFNENNTTVILLPEVDFLLMHKQIQFKVLRDLLQHCTLNKITIHYLHRKLEDTGSLNPLLLLDFPKSFVFIMARCSQSTL